MSDYEFTLLIEGDLTDASIVAALYDAGCDDATFGVVDGVSFGEFVREAPSLPDALWSAIGQVETTGLTAIRVEPEDIVSMADIADRLDRTRESVRLLITGQRGPGGFPAPMSHARVRGRLWRWSDVAAWLGQLDKEDLEDAHFIAAVNAALELRRQTEALHDQAWTKPLLELVSSRHALR
jgi:hypothetical protein